jgi:HSP20 family protein
MSLMWRDPMEMATPLRDVMSRLFEESFIWPERFEMGAARGFPIDLRESDDRQSYILEANIAGFKPEEVQVTSTGDTLTIHAEKKEEMKTEKAGYLRHERHMGAMSRTVTLPSHIDSDKIQATCEHGVIMLRIPKAEGAKTKQIPIKAQGQ